MIARAEEKLNFVHVFDEKGKKLFHKTGKLVSFTAMHVNINVMGKMVHVFDEKGKKTSQYML